MLFSFTNFFKSFGYLSLEIMSDNIDQVETRAIMDRMQEEDEEFARQLEAEVSSSFP